MTTPPPLPTPHEPNAPEQRESGSWRTPFAWLALVLICTLMVGLHMWDSAAASGAAPSATTAPAEPIDPALDRTAMLRIVGQYALGVKTLGETMPALSAGSAMDQLMESIDRQSTTPVERVRAAMLSAEIAGVDQAREIAQALADNEALDAGLREDAALILKAIDPAHAIAREALTPDEAARLTQRHFWFAEALLARGLPSTDPARVAVLDAGERSIAVVVGAVLVAALAFFAGFVLLAVAAVQYFSGQLKPAYAADASLPASTAVHRAALLESLVLFVIAILVLGTLGQIVEIASGLDLSFALMWLALPIALWPRLWGMDRATWKRALGWHTGRGFFREIGAGIVGYLAALPIVAVGLATTFVLIMLTDASPSHPVVEKAAAGGTWNAVQIMILACLWAPICEETFFRGAMYAHCRRWMGPLVSAVLVAFVFAAIHPQGWAVVPSLMGLAVGFALIREWRGSLIAPIMAHAIQNGFVMSMNLLLLG